MCGRYSMVQGAERLGAALGVKVIALMPRYNIAPTQNAPVVLHDLQTEMKLLRWGLIPSWAKDESISARMINARAETLLEKPSFRIPFLRRRCLVLADGYYEWQITPRGKQPFRFTMKNGEPFTFAALWDAWRKPDATVLQSFTIITTQANALTQPVHDRMPVILPLEHYRQWLDPDCTNLDSLQKCLLPSNADLMRCFPVSTWINNVHNDDSRCIEPLLS